MTREIQPILDEVYWRYRIRDAREKHHAVFRCSLDRWNAIADNHRQILKQLIQPGEHVLDAGCGYGRLVDLLPEGHGWYMGIDLSPDMVDLARKTYPKHTFSVMDLRKIELPDDVFDWAVLISIRPMVIRECGQQVWDQMYEQLRRVATKLLFLEYDPNDKGEVVLVRPTRV